MRRRECFESHRAYVEYLEQRVRFLERRLREYHESNRVQGFERKRRFNEMAQPRHKSVDLSIPLADDVINITFVEKSYMIKRILKLADCKNARCRCCVAFPVYALSVLTDNSSRVAEKVGCSESGDVRFQTNIPNIPSVTTKPSSGTLADRRAVFVDMLADYLIELMRNAAPCLAHVIQNGTFNSYIKIEYVTKEKTFPICDILYDDSAHTMSCRCHVYDLVNKAVKAKDLDVYANELLNF